MRKNEVLIVLLIIIFIEIIITPIIFILLAKRGKRKIYERRINVETIQKNIEETTNENKVEIKKERITKTPILVNLSISTFIKLFLAILAFIELIVCFHLLIT